MSVQLATDGSIVLEGACPSDDAEILLQRLISAPGSTVDWRACESVHTAVLQVLMASKARMLGPPASRFLRDWVQPLLSGGTPLNS